MVTGWVLSTLLHAWTALLSCPGHLWTTRRDNVFGPICTAGVLTASDHCFGLFLVSPRRPSCPFSNHALSLLHRVLLDVDVLWGSWSPRSLPIYSLEPSAVFMRYYSISLGLRPHGALQIVSWFCLSSFSDLYTSFGWLRLARPICCSYLCCCQVSHHFCQRALAITAWMEHTSICLEARYIPGERNNLADQFSRPDQILPTEWFLLPCVFNRFCRAFGRPHLDLFTTGASNKFPLYVSPVPDLLAWKQDALHLPLDLLDVYTFPTFALLHQVIM